MTEVRGPWRGRQADGSAWSLTAHSEGFVLLDKHGELRLQRREANQINVRSRWLRTHVTIGTAPTAGRDQLRGLSRKQGRDLRQAVHAALLAEVLDWSDAVDAAISRASRDLAWISEEYVAALLVRRPDTTRVEPSPTQGEREGRALLRSAHDVRAGVRAVNARIAEGSLKAYKELFDTVEASPLTDEQARAVVTYDNRVNVIAAAGSGKTSVMVARAAYAIKRRLAEPGEILLLAFNAEAAAELQHRLRARLEAASIPAEGLQATTFHAFGLKVIGQATGRKPTVAPWVANGQDIDEISKIIHELREKSPRFGRDWDIFRLVFARAGEDPAQDPEPDAWDRDRRLAGLRTYKGDIVRSHGERMIADWLFLHGVPYEYERPYIHDTVDPEHGQYRPDFFYPEINTWHEHWGIGADGKPPSQWSGYEAGMTWKRELHRERGTTLLETTWAGVMEGSDLDRLSEELGRRGVQLQFDPRRATRTSSKPMADADLIRLVRSFLAHVKSNSLTRDALEQRVQRGWVRNAERARKFLHLFWEVHASWQTRLQAGGYVDFEDMLVQAAEHIEARRYTSPHSLVMVDEFQDVSHARARLTRSLVNQPDRHLMVVGDDWQSINRFAGADVSVVTHFHEFFGPGPQLHLTKTFRSHPAIVDVAARFVAKNPAQQAKRVVSVHDRVLRPGAHEGVHVRVVGGTSDIGDAVRTFLLELDDSIRKRLIVGKNDARVTVDVLGRYRHDREVVPTTAPQSIQLRFRTIHSAKGLEADYVIVPNLSAGTYGFPSQIADDPVLDLAMADLDAYPHAEERRLFYVALTRARRGVLLISPEANPSPFLTELVKDGLVRVGGERASMTPCPECGAGVLRQRTGRYGVFWGCSNFPRCRYTSKGF